MLLLIRHAFSVTRHSTIGENSTAFFNVSSNLHFWNTMGFLLIYCYWLMDVECWQVSLFQFAGILLSCYVIVRTCYLFQNRRQRHQNYLRQVRCWEFLLIGSSVIFKLCYFMCRFGDSQSSKIVGPPNLNLQRRFLFVNLGKIRKCKSAILFRLWCLKSMNWLIIWHIGICIK